MDYNFGYKTNVYCYVLLFILFWFRALFGFGIKENDISSKWLKLEYLKLVSSLRSDSTTVAIGSVFRNNREKTLDLYDHYYDSLKFEENANKLFYLTYRFGLLLFDNGEFDEAVEVLKKNVNHKLNGDIYTRFFIDESKHLLAQAYSLKFQPDSAFYYLNQVLQFRNKEFGNDSLTAVANMTMAQISDRNNMNKSGAVKYFLRAIEILKEINCSPLLIESYYGLMQSYANLGNHDLSETYGKTALGLIEKNNLSNSELHERVLWRMGWTFNNQKEYDKARDYLERAYSMINYADRYRENFRKSHCLKALGISYLGLKNYSRALESFNSAMEYTLLSKPKISSPVAVGHYYFGLANLEKFENESVKDTAVLEKAIGYFYQAENIFQQLDSLGFDQRSRSRNYRRLTKAYHLLGHKDSTMKYAQKSIFLKSRYSNLIENPSVKHFLKNYSKFLALGQKSKFYSEWYLNNDPEFSFESVIPIYLAIDSTVSFHRKDVLGEKANLYLNRKNLKYYEGALEIIFHEINKNGVSDRLKELALKFMENSKASILLKSIKESELYQSVGVPDSILEKLAGIKGRLAYLRNLELKEVEEKNKEIRMEMLNATSRLRELKDTIRINYLNENFDNSNAKESISFYDAADYSGNKKKIVVEYFYGEKAIYGLSINGSELKFITVNRTDELDNSILEFKQDIMNGIPLEGISTSCKKYDNHGFLLFDKLLKGLVENLSEKNLLIIPDGYLSYLPFEALITKVSSQKNVQYSNLNYVLRNFNISYAYSLSAQLNQKFNPKIRKPKILAFSYSDNKLISNTLMSNRGGLKELPGAVEEINAISQIFPTGNFFFGESATESKFKEKIGHFNMLHLAMHNITDHNNPLNTKISFRPENDSVEDGELFVHELYKLNLNSDLVILSTCESGIGKWNKGEGVYSLGRSLSNLGCASIITSLWKVDDRSTAKIMNFLYENLKNGLEVEKSLQNAKVEYLISSDGLLAHPSNWAGFIFTGETVKISKEKFVWNRIIALALFLLLLLLFVLKPR